MNKILRVALENISYSADLLYSYKPNGDFNFELGQRVIVPFGKCNAKRQGVILGIDDGSECDNLKEIFAIVDKESLIDGSMIGLIEYVKNKYFCTYFDVVRLILPPGCGGGTGNIRYKIKDDFAGQKLLENEINFFDLIKNNYKDGITLKQISALKFPGYNSIISSFVNKGLMEEILDFDKTVGQKSVTRFKVIDGSGDFGFLTSDKQRKVCEFLTKQAYCTLKEIQYYTGVSAAVVNGLVKKGILESDKKIEYVSPRVSDENYAHEVPDEIVLNGEQKQAYEKIINDAEGRKYVSLLYGVTGSGKTAVLIKLIDKVFGEGKNVIFMLPEIALTSQFIHVFKSRYGKSVEVVHSGLTDWQRYDIWKRVRSGEIKIIVGTRSAVFAPFHEIGLIIIDEEHEFTYKSDFAPMYDTREVAAYRCKKSGGRLVLVSATPSVESYYMASTGKYNLCTLNNRYGESALPNVQIIDMNKNSDHETNNLFSESLLTELKDVIERGEQAVLLINRRGFNSFVKCAECGEVLTCPNCSVSLNYHKANGRLMCHFCGYSSESIKICPTCRKENLVYLGVGTQKVEDVLLKKLPSAKILRLDSDVKNCKNSLANDIEKFMHGEYNILLGTQMVAKGFNFPKVTLVGIISADNFLYDSDFRSGEKIFSLITQVVGRAGRMGNKGRAIIQTFAPDHEIIRMSARQNYVNFYNNEVSVRKLMLNPPFCDICVINFSGKTEKNVADTANGFLKLLKDTASKKYGDIPLRIYAPVEARIKMLAKNYRYKIMIKCKNNSIFRRFISEVLAEFYMGNKTGSVSIWPAINPDITL